MAQGVTDTQTHPKRIHYQLTFAVLSLAAMAYSLLQSLVIPALPSLEHSLHASADAVASPSAAFTDTSAVPFGDASAAFADTSAVAFGSGSAGASSARAGLSGEKVA